ncbi:hypothetical protein GCM10009001_25990 [Virgibacillus siamensis]|uniref:Lysozyme inhibitor LprI-like N-terminal domain-containing protein n=1 Tax=Virgibacillus siamensis TaxID=480071 RepID=A0ABP3RHB4_9BACI
MKKRKMRIILLTAILAILLAACENSSEASSTAADEPSQDNSTSEGTNNTDSTERAANDDSAETGNHETNEQTDATEEDNGSADNTAASMKETYLKKLNETKSEMENLEATDPSTYAMKKVENDRYDTWDELLNEIYGVLKKQLPAEEMDQLRNEQRDWIEHRDDAAKDASLKYEGGTQEQLEYVAVLADLTKKRCYTLVEEYMQ